MTDQSGVNYAKRFTTPSTKIAPSDRGARVRAMYDEYVFAANPTDADTIQLGDKIPANARIVGGWLKAPAMGTGGSFLVGKTGDTDALLAATSVAAASFTWFNGDDVGDVLAADTQYFITMANAASATSGTIQACILYPLD
jgi:hypothetical protein